MKVLLITICDGDTLIAPMIIEACPSVGSHVCVSGVLFHVDQVIHYDLHLGVVYKGASRDNSIWKSGQEFYLAAHVSQIGDCSYRHGWELLSDQLLGQTVTWEGF